MRKERSGGKQLLILIIKIQIFYKRNFYGFRGDEFDPKDVKIVFEGGSAGNQRYTPEKYTIVGLLNQNFKSENIDLKCQRIYRWKVTKELYTILYIGFENKQFQTLIYGFLSWYY